jgi:hypothetical protein
MPCELGRGIPKGETDNLLRSLNFKEERERRDERRSVFKQPLRYVPTEILLIPSLALLRPDKGSREQGTCLCIPHIHESGPQESVLSLWT